MSIWKSKYVAALLAFVMLFSLSAVPALAHGNGHEKHQGNRDDKHKRQHQQHSAPIPTPSTNQPTSMPEKRTDIPQLPEDRIIMTGAKSWLLKQSLELMADGLRAGVRSPIVRDVIRDLDYAAYQALERHSYKIANRLDYIATIPDVTITIVRENLYNFLRYQVKLSGGTSNVISQCIAGVLNALI